MQLRLVVVKAHLCYQGSGFHRCPFLHQAFLTVCIGAQVGIAVFNDDQITIIGQTITTIYDSAIGDRAYRLAGFAGDIYTAAIEQILAFAAGKPINVVDA